MMKARTSFLPWDVDVEDGHGVVAEDVYDFDGDFAATGGAFVEDAG
jgi:hypothetical protein